MITFFRCVLEAILANGVEGLLEMVPGGKYLYSVGSDTLKRYSDKKHKQKLEDSVKEMVANSSKQEVKKVIDELIENIEKGVSKRHKELLEQYMIAIPESARQSMIRRDDPSGRTVPFGYAIKSQEDVVKLLPQYPPRFVIGDDIPGLPGWKLSQLLGIGGCGEVWLARNGKKHQQCGAIKFAHPDRAPLLKHEAGLIRQVMSAGDHPNVVRLLKANLEANDPWLLYEYIPGKLDLSDTAQ